MSIQEILIYLVLSTILGFGVFKILYAFLPKKFSSEHQTQKNEILHEAKKHADMIKDESKRIDEAKIQMLREEVEMALSQKEEDLKQADSDLNILEQQISPLQSRVQKLENDLVQAEQHAEFAKSNMVAQKQASDSIRLDLRSSLEAKSAHNSSHLLKNMTQDMVDVRHLEIQKLLKLQNEELANSAKKIATRFLARSLSRYAPEFPWPKASNTVEVENLKVFDSLSTQSAILAEQLKALAGVDTELMPPRFEGAPAIIKLSGGMGVERESARLALSDMIKTPQSQWERIADHYQKNRQLLDQQALKLGRLAVTELQLEGIHIEVIRLIGNLNWRTSYRQNQFLHSFEVGMLAGLVADELDVDPRLAKRSGLLHDIGKVLDYRIEGSHAVISGDYADRYGETKLLCDTLMSHHNDLVVETPLAYVLKAADTLSGARPGARVNLEEGYQERLSAIDDVVRSIHGVTKSVIMNGGREIHIEVNHKKINDHELEALTKQIAKKIEQDVAFPGQIKVMVTRRFESSSVA